MGIPSKDSRWKVASSPEQWDAAAEVLEKKAEHAAIKVLRDGYDRVLKAIDEADRKSKNMKRIGVGKTADPDLVLAEVVPAIQELGEECMAIVKQMKTRFGGS